MVWRQRRAAAFGAREADEKIFKRRRRRGNVQHRHARPGQKAGDFCPFRPPVGGRLHECQVKVVRSPLPCRGNTADAADPDDVVADRLINLDQGCAPGHTGRDEIRLMAGPTTRPCRMKMTLSQTRSISAN